MKMFVSSPVLSHNVETHRLMALNELEKQRRIINPFDWTYHTLMRRIMRRGIPGEDRTKTGVKYDLFGTMMQFNLNNGTVPVITSKKVQTRATIVELLWLLSGRTNVKELVDQNVHIWSAWPAQTWLTKTKQQAPDRKDIAAWKDVVRRFEHEIKHTPGFAEEFGDLGPVYGKQWRRWQGLSGEVDQIALLLAHIREKPDCRRLIVESWKVDEIADGSG